MIKDEELEKFSGDMIGSLTWGTLRTSDIVKACLFFLSNHHPKALEHLESRCLDYLNEEPNTELKSLYDLYHLPDEDPLWSSDAIAWFHYEDLSDLMQELAPNWCYFGSSPGDGSDIGYWLDYEHLEEEIRYGIHLLDLTFSNVEKDRWMDYSTIMDFLESLVIEEVPGMMLAELLAHYLLYLAFGGEFTMSVKLEEVR